jgi:hypothetical protein
MTTISTPRYPTAWKIYSCFVVAMMLLSVVVEGVSFNSVLSIAFSFGLTTPLMGYAWQSRLVPKWLGVLSMCLAGLSVISALVLASNSQGAEMIIWIFAIFVMVPYLYATYMYTYRSSHLDPLPLPAEVHI